MKYLGVIVLLCSAPLAHSQWVAEYSGLYPIEYMQCCPQGQCPVYIQQPGSVGVGIWRQPPTIVQQPQQQPPKYQPRPSISSPASPMPSTPTIDPKALEKFKAEATASAVAAAKAEVSVLVKQEVASQGAVPGPPGPQGPQGLQGPPGPAGGAASTKPFFLRVKNFNGELTPYTAVLPGQYVTLDLQPIANK